MLGAGVTVDYEKGADVVGPADAEAVARAVALAKRSDVVILCLGTDQRVEAEGRDRRDLNLPGAQQPLLEAVFAANPKVALVLFNAGPLGIGWAHDRLPAILAAWFPGEAGGIAVARSLFGLDNPGGKLPYTVYANLDGVPPQNEYDVSKGYTYMYFKGVPLYPFGHGLSYTRFRFTNLTLSAPSISTKGQVEVSFDVTNVGDRAGRRGGAALHASAEEQGLSADSHAASLPPRHAQAQPRRRASRSRSRRRSSPGTRAEPSDRRSSPASSTSASARRPTTSGSARR